MNQTTQSIIDHFEMDSFFAERIEKGVAAGLSFVTIVRSMHNGDNEVTGVHATEAEAITEMEGIDEFDGVPVAVVDMTTGLARETVKTVRLKDAVSITAIEV